MADKIYKIYKDSSNIKRLKELYSGDLNFGGDAPIETLASYENNELRKVYWTDNLNQARVINLDRTIREDDDNQFDLVQNIAAKEIVTIVKTEGSGLFPAGTVQYCFTYFNQYGSETNVVYLSQIYYTSFPNRAGAPDETVGNCFTITIKNPDSRFEYLRLFRLTRTSQDATPTVKQLIDIPLDGDNPLSFTDNNTLGFTIASSDLLYKGGEIITCKTMCSKDNTLFMGNLSMGRKNVGDLKLSTDVTLEDTLKNTIGNLRFIRKPMYLEDCINKYYGYKPFSGDGSYTSRTLKSREWYRFGLIFQHQSGKWSEPLWIGDKQVDTTPLVSRGAGKINISGIEAVYDFDSNGLIAQRLVNAGYIAVRPVIVYPQASDRSVVAQGVLNPTMFNLQDRYNGIADNIASWYFRPAVTGQDDADTSHGWNAVFDHLACLPTNNMNNAEVQNIAEAVPYTMTSIYNGVSYNDHFIEQYGNQFCVDRSVLTMNCPDVEFDSAMNTIDGKSYKLRLMGRINLSGFYSDCDLTAGTVDNEDGRGFIRRRYSSTNYSDNKYSGYIELTFPGWHDGEYKNEEDSEDDETYGAGLADLTNTTRPYSPDYFVIYPWHANRSLNNAPVTDNRPCMLKTKYMSNLRYSGDITYLDSPLEYNIGPVTLFNSTEDTLTRIDANTSCFKKSLAYKGNVDKVITATDTADHDGFQVYKMLGTAKSGREYTASPKHFHDPVRMRYKSTPHLAFALSKTVSSGTDTQVLLPSAQSQYFSGVKVFWSDQTYYASGVGYAPVNDVPYLWLGELYRDDITEATRFGGESKDALIANTWIPCGETYSLYGANNKLRVGIPIEYSDGDTYLQRYDCLKTYPFALEDQNSIVEILSYYTETRVNLDGRYDKNRGNLSNLVAMPTNFNLINMAYTQNDTFFTYKCIDYTFFKSTKFPTSFTWSLAKNSGDEIDPWTQTTLASTADATVDCGNIQKMVTYNDQIYAFQDKGIFNILFNSRVAISTTDGVPIQLSNSGKMEGLRYISRNMGLRNKWSLCETSNALYFVDDLGKSIIRFSDKMENLSDSMGFHGWVKKNIENAKEWDIIGFRNMTTHYDKIHDDVYFTTDTECLDFNETFASFSSFLSYENTPYMFNIWDNFLSIRGLTGPYDGSAGMYNCKLWDQNTGDYNSFFGQYKPSSVTIISNPDVVVDKTFTNMEFCGDMWSVTDNTPALLPDSPIDKIRVWNEYQDTLEVAGDAKEKFRVWRMNIPRADAQDLQGRPINTLKLSKMDRIRGTWAYMKLTHTPKVESGVLTTNTKIIIHDLVVYYII